MKNVKDDRHNQNKRRALSVAAAVLVGSILLLSFQNCGSFGANSTFGIQQNQAFGTPVNNILSLEDLAKQNTPFRVAANLGQFDAGTEYYWSASYADSTTCTVSVSTDGSVATFQCAKLGAVSVLFVATGLDGSLQNYQLPLVVGDGITGTTPTPTPSATPIPTPTPLDGVALYNSNCGACHGTLPGNSTREGISLTALNTAIASVGAMAGLSGLTNAERAAIVQALQ